MEHPTGRHRRPRQTLAGRVWALTAAMLAIALAYVFVPDRPQKQQHAITHVPRLRELPPPLKKSAPPSVSPGFPRHEAWARSASQTSVRWGSGYYDSESMTAKNGSEPGPAPEPDSGPEPDPDSDPDEVAGALVRPYLVSALFSARMPRIPGPRVPMGNLLSVPVEPTAQDGAGDLDDLARVVRVYLDRVG